MEEGELIEDPEQEFQDSCVAEMKKITWKRYIKIRITRESRQTSREEEGKARQAVGI